MPRLLRRDEAAEYLYERYGIRRKPTTLAKLACVGGGPKFQRDGRLPLYPPEELDQWAESILTPPAASTAEHDARTGRRRQPRQSAQAEAVSQAGAAP